jgi:hypothetical protein
MCFYDSLNYRPAAFKSNSPAEVAELAFCDRIDAVALAEGLPIHSIGGIKQNLIFVRISACALRTAIQDFDYRLVGSAQRVRNDYNRMETMSQIASPDIPSVHFFRLAFRSDRSAPRAIANSRASSSGFGA